MASRNFSDLWGGRGVFATKPFMEMQRDLNRLFGDTFRRGPRLDMRENDDEVCVVADVPGVAPADLDLRIDGATLTLFAERQSESDREDQNYHVMERSRGVMRRSVQLPFAPDPEKVRANYENGVLTVRVPKAGEKRGQRIDVQGGADANASSGSAGTGADSKQFFGTASSQSTPPAAAASSATGATVSVGGPDASVRRASESEGPGTTAGGSV